MTRSVTRIFFSRAASRLLVRLKRTLVNQRGALPNVKAAGCENAEVLNHRAIDGLETGTSFMLVTFGCWLPPNELVLFVAVKCAGSPEAIR